MAGKEFGNGVSWIRGSLIGKGSYGHVYRATLKNPTSKYSCFPPVMAVKSAEVSVSTSIQKETEILSNLQSCNNIIGCYGSETTVGPTGMMAYNMLLEYASGGTLAEKIKKSSGLLEIEVKEYTRSILRGLKHIHDLGYVHCDLKPDNILLVEKTAKIGDFGLAKRGSKLEPPNLRGTLKYMSPEAVIDYVHETPCDIWAVGCIVIEMLTGKSLFDGEREAILRKIGEGVKIPSDVLEEARGFLRRCFPKNPTSRWSAEMLLRHEFLEGLLDDEETDEESSSLSSFCSGDDDEDEEEEECSFSSFCSGDDDDDDDEIGSSGE